MSRIGNNPITIEEGVQINIDGKKVTVKGSKGELVIFLPHVLDAKVEDNTVIVSRINDEKQSKSMHGTFRSLIANAVYGVSKGYSKELEIVGVGYRAKKEGNKLSISLGWTHPVVVEPPADIEIDVPSETSIIVKGIDKQKVGEWAAKIRALRKPEPYKGKGIRYKDEYVRRKSSKTVEAG